MKQAPVRQDAANDLITKSATIIPDEQGNVDTADLRELYMTFEGLRQRIDHKKLSTVNDYTLTCIF